MVGISTDGAAVMVGSNTGLCTRLAKRAPFLIQNHCVTHRLNLAYKDAESEQLLGENLDDLIKDIYKFFKKSPSKCLDLEKYAKLRSKRAYKLLRVYDIRWLSKFNAISNIFKNLEILLDLLRDYSHNLKYESRDQALSLYKHLRLSESVFLLFMMTEVLTDWTALLKKFQGEEYSLMTMDKDIESFDFKVTLEYIKGESLRSTNLLY
jgi:hypothetical protein